MDPCPDGVLVRWCSETQIQQHCFIPQSGESREEFAKRAGATLKQLLLDHPLTDDCP